MNTKRLQALFLIMLMFIVLTVSAFADETDDALIHPAYFDLQTGERYTGVHKIDGKTYNFGTDGITVTATGPWLIKVNQSTCTVTVYRGDTPVNAFACSPGAGGATPTGTFRLLDKLRWHELMGPSWGQWCSHITASILFCSSSEKAAS